METITRTCAADGCDRPGPHKRAAHGLCLMHYKRWKRRGTVHDITTEERFFSHVEQIGKCWLWMAFRQPDGDYGKFWLDDKCLLAHRWSYEFLRTEIPAGLDLDHLCRTPPCVNPWHLEPVTDLVNVVVRGTGITAINARKTHCLRGHSFDEANTYITPKRGRRHCRACAVIRHRK